MKTFGWTWDELMNTPNWVIDALLEIISAENSFYREQSKGK